MAVGALAFAAMAGPLCGRGLDRTPGADEVDYYPHDGHRSSTNPPAFIWLPVEGVGSYILQYSRDASFSPTRTTTVRNLDMTVHVPTETLEPGVWHWRYGYSDGSREGLSRVRRFEVPATAGRFPFIPVERVIERIPRERPRLNFSPELVREIRSDDGRRFGHVTRQVIEEAGTILAMNEPLFEEPKPWDKYDDPRMAYVNAWRSMRPYTQRMVTSALAYLYTGDERYAAEARRRLMHFMTWDVDGPSSAIWPTELGMDIAENAPPVFDWIYDTLGDEERETCKRVLAARMRQISYEVHRARPMETRPFSSHPGRMVGFVVEGSIALAHDVPEVADWLDYTLKLLWTTYPAWSYADGGWHEGVSYWSSYMRRMIRVVAELDRLGIPLKDKPFFCNTGYFGLYVAYPGRPVSAFGDSHENPVGRGHGELMYALSTLYRNPYFRWHAEMSGALPTGRAALLHLYPDLRARQPVDLPLSRAFKDVGLVAMHSNLAEPGENVALLFQSNPFGAISHNFACQNAFVIEAFGEPLAISTGARQLHGSPHHREWMWHTKAHNSILVDGEGQVTRQRDSRGKIIAHVERGDFVYTAGDATEAYGGRLERFHRHILFIRPDWFVIVDDLKTSGSAATFQWLLHGPTEIFVDSTAQLAVSRSGNARLMTRFLAPGNLDFRQHTGFTPQVEEPARFRNQFHLAASTRRPASLQRFVTVMRVDRTDGVPIVRPESPTTTRRELAIRSPGDDYPIDEALSRAELLDAEGGIAVRIGRNLVLWKEPGASRVAAAGTFSTEEMMVKRDFF